MHTSPQCSMWTFTSTTQLGGSGSWLQWSLTQVSGASFLSVAAGGRGRGSTWGRRGHRSLTPPEGRRQAAGSRQQAAGGRRQATDGRRQTAGGRRREADGGRQTAGGRRQAADGRRQARCVWPIHLYRCVTARGNGKDRKRGALTR